MLFLLFCTQDPIPASLSVEDRIQIISSLCNQRPTQTFPSLPLEDRIEQASFMLGLWASIPHYSLKQTIHMMDTISALPEGIPLPMELLQNMIHKLTTAPNATEVVGILLLHFPPTIRQEFFQYLRMQVQDETNPERQQEVLSMCAKILRNKSHNPEVWATLLDNMPLPIGRSIIKLWLKQFEPFCSEGIPPSILWIAFGYIPSRFQQDPETIKLFMGNLKGNDAYWIYNQLSPALQQDESLIDVLLDNTIDEVDPEHLLATFERWPLALQEKWHESMVVCFGRVDNLQIMHKLFHRFPLLWSERARNCWHTTLAALWKRQDKAIPDEALPTQTENFDDLLTHLIDKTASTTEWEQFRHRAPSSFIQRPEVLSRLWAQPNYSNALIAQDFLYVYPQYPNLIESIIEGIEKGRSIDPDGPLYLNFGLGCHLALRKGIDFVVPYVHPDALWHIFQSLPWEQQTHVNTLQIFLHQFPAVRAQWYVYMSLPIQYRQTPDAIRALRRGVERHPHTFASVYPWLALHVEGDEWTEFEAEWLALERRVGAANPVDDIRLVGSIANEIHEYTLYVQIEEILHKLVPTLTCDDIWAAFSCSAVEVSQHIERLDPRPKQAAQDALKRWMEIIDNHYNTSENLAEDEEVASELADGDDMEVEAEEGDESMEGDEAIGEDSADEEGESDIDEDELALEEETISRTQWLDHWLRLYTILRDAHQPWFADYQKADDRWQAWLMGSLVEAGMAYDGSGNRVSCPHGLYEFLFTGMRTIHPDFQQLFLDAEHNKLVRAQFSTRISRLVNEIRLLPETDRAPLLETKLAELFKQLGISAEVQMRPFFQDSIRAARELI